MEPPGQPLHRDQWAGLGPIRDPSWGEAQRHPRAPGTGTQKAVWALGSERRDLGPIRGPCPGGKLASGGQSCRGLPRQTELGQGVLPSPEKEARQARTQGRREPLRPREAADAGAKCQRPLCTCSGPRTLEEAGPV
uniref:Uncharacterized protein n=1 Tax=Myotis myotis TaxID=51298 RepID=A0A7J7QWB5_MYOMY|nr:hypothetical protein mMyoMyo1_011288 [Myotis myotis]